MAPRTATSVPRPDSSDLILVSEENKANLQALAEDLAGDHPPAAFIGAGISARAGYPAWQGLIKGMFARLEVLEHAAIQDGRPLAQRVADIMHMPDDLAWTAKACLDLFEVHGLKEEYYEQLRTTFAGSRGPNAVLSQLVRLPFAHFLTTNYDPSIHESYEEAHKRSLRVVDWGLECKLNSLPALGSVTKTCIHLHGYHENPTRIILNENDYQERYINSAQHIAVLKNFLARTRVVFIGFSFEDPDFVSLLRTLRATDRRKRARHFAILPLSDARPDAYVKTASVRLKDKYNIRAIYYRQLTNDYRGLEEAIRLLVYHFGRGSKVGASRLTARKPSVAKFKFDPRALKKPKFVDDPNKQAFGGSAMRNGRRLTARVVRTKKGGRWFRIELHIEAMRGSPDFKDAGTFYVHPSFRKVKYDGELGPGNREIVKTFWAYGAFTVGALVDGGKTALELDLAKLSSAPKDFRER